MPSVKAFVIVIALLFSLFAPMSYADSPVDATEESALSIENYEDSELVHYSVVTLRGRAPGVERGVVVAENLASDKGTRIVRSEVVQGRFKALVELVPGRNDFLISVGSRRLSFALFYRKSFNKSVVRLIYFVPYDSAEGKGASVDALFPLKDCEIARKLKVAARLWQTATAERLSDLGYGRRTFALETGENDEIDVWLKRGKRSAKEYRELSPKERFTRLRREVFDASQRVDGVCFFVCFDARKEGELEYCPDDALALGDDAFSVLDAKRTTTWPELIADVVPAFADVSAAPKESLRESAYRGTRWALTASTLGAGWHELSHAFGLKHSTDPSDVMSRGFDRFNRVFTVYEPPCVLHDGLVFDENDNAGWSRENAEILLRSQWITE